jgi:RNA polymerase sigma-70 factor, ECF subfamily
MDSTSTTLLDRLRGPDARAAWDHFARLYAPLLLTWAKAWGLHDADAADLAQEVLVKVMAQFPRYARRPGESFRGWLFQLAKNACADFRAARATRPLPGAKGLSDVPAPEPSADDYRAHLARAALAVVRADFAEATWAAFTGLVLEGKPVAEVAAALNLTPNAVFLARHRVLTRLRAELAQLAELLD